MQCPKCQYENSNEAKFCMECGTKLASICSNCGKQLPQDAKFCSECGTKVGTSSAPELTREPVPRLEEMQERIYIPKPLAERMRAAEQEMVGENRLVTAMFADISGFTPLSRQYPTERVVEIINGCFQSIVDIILSYEGNINRFIGDCVLAFFGAPITHENDPERAILAALDIQEAVKGLSLSLSVGINSGMMYFGPIGAQKHLEISAYGTDINLAARLQGAAKPGQILVGPGTYRLTRRAFDFQRLEGLTLKGIGEGLFAYEALHVTSRPEKLRGIEGLRARMIGREREFAELKEAADGWLAGQGQMVSVIGEAGIGKSRLVTELKTYLTSPPAPLLRGEGSQSPSPLVGEGRGEGEKLLWLEGRCISIGHSISYWPFLDILRAYFNLSEADSEGEIARKVTEGVKGLFQTSEQTSEVSKTSEVSTEAILPFLGNLLSIRFGNELDNKLEYATPEQIRHQTLMRLRDLFEALARRGPLMLILEDLHWADDLSLDLISLLMDSLATTPLMTLCVYRPEREHRVWQLSSLAQRKCLDRYTEIQLKQLSSGQSRRLVEELLTIDNLPESVKATILRKSEGNPFFIEEVIRSLIDRDVVYREEDRWKARAEIADIDVPDTIQGVVLARVDRLNAEAKHVLQCASVIGRLFKYRLLEHLARQERNLDQYLSELEERELVYEERTVPELEYAFKHAFTQEATYQGILERRRRGFHGQVAAGIERLYQERLEEYYEELAYHYSRSDDAAKAVDYLLKAGDRARKLYANEEAITYLSQALNLAPADDHAKRYAILLSREQVYDIQGKRDLQRQDLETLKGLVEALGDDRRRAEVSVRQARYAQATNDYPLAIATAQGAIGWAQATGDKSSEAAGYMTWGHALSRAFGMGKNTEAKVYYEQALRIYREIGDRQGEGRVLNSLGLACGGQVDPVGARAYYEQSIHICREIGDRPGEAAPLHNLSYIILAQGDYAGARANWEQVLRIQREIGNRPGEASVLGDLANVSAMQGNYAQAMAECEHSLRISREVGTRSGEAWTLNVLGTIYLRQGDYALARDSYEQALGIAHEIGYRLVENWSLNELGNMCKLHGNYAGARAYYEQALRLNYESGNRNGESSPLYTLSTLAISEGDYAQARDYCEQSLHISREMGNRNVEVWGLLLLGDIYRAQGDYTDAKATYEEALHIFRESGNRGGEVRGMISVGLVSHYLGDHEAARQCSQEALNLAGELGDRRPHGEALNLLGRALVGLGNLAEGAEAYRGGLTACRQMGQPHQAMESLAGLAEIALAQGNLTEAQAHVEEILTHTETYKLDLLEPLRVYLICYRVLHANQDPRAQAVLSTAHQMLSERAAKITDENLRRSYLENVAVHQEIVSEFEKGN